MAEKKQWKQILSVALSAGMLVNSTLPVAAMELQQTEKAVYSNVTAETPAEYKTGDLQTRNVLIGGVNNITELEFSEEDGQDIEYFEVDEEEINGLMEEREKIAQGNGANANYGYSTLNTQEQKVYNYLLKSMIAFDNSTATAECVERSYKGNYYAAGKVDISSYKMTKSQMEKIYFALEADNLDFFWLDDTIGLERQGDTITSWYIMVEPDYILSSTRTAARGNMKKGIQPFLEKIDNAKAAGAGEMELELLIHDMIIEEVDYAYNAFGNPQTASYAHTIVGVFDGISSTDVVCEGYAKAFKYLCNYAGLESIYAVGWSTSDGYSGGHAWNMIKIGGKWYNIDLTWDDANGTEYDGYIYDYYNLPTSKFNEGNAHDYREDIFGGMYTVPNAVSTEASYYNYFGMSVNAASIATEDAFLNLMKKAIGTSEVRGDYLLRFQCDSTTTLQGLKAKVNEEELCKTLFNSLNSNGVVYALDSVEVWQSYNNLLVSISKTYVENMCNGYVFGNPTQQTVVYEWKKREKADITGNCQLLWGNANGKGTLQVTKGTETIGSYEYTSVVPEIGKIADQQYTGKGICPGVSVKVNGKALQLNKDYKLEYSNNRNIGTAALKITGIGSYSGTTTTSFRIVAKNIQGLTVSLEQSEYAYDGTPKKPAVQVSDGENILQEGEDYTLSYKNNVNVGTASVSITGKGNYQGTKTVDFYVVPGKVSAVKLKKGTGNSLKFSYSKQNGVSGYEVSLYQGKKSVKVIYTTKTSYTFKKLKANTQYTVKVRAFVNAGQKKYGTTTSLTVKTATKAPTKLKITKKSKSAILQWSKMKGASGYEIYMSSKKKSGYKKVATISSGTKTKYTKKKLSSKKTYYFKVRSYTTKNKYKAYSEFSPVKKVTIP